MTKKIYVLALCALLAGCCSPTPNFYQPTTVTSTDIGYPKVKGTVLVQQVLLPAVVSRPQITTLGKKDFELKIDEFNRWGAAPEKLISQTVAQNLKTYLPNAVVEMKTPLRKNYQYAVMIEISSLSGRLDEFAALDAVYFIKNKAGRVIKSGVMSEKRAIEGGYEAYVMAQSGLLGALSAQIAADLAKM